MDFIMKYWVEFAFSIAAAGIWWVVRRYLKLEAEHREKEQQKLLEIVKADIEKEHEKSSTGDEALKSEINVLNNILTGLKRGLLSVQGRQFKSDCRRLLDEEHIMSLEEYEQITADHEAYKGLGGNHNGDTLYDLVCKKYVADKKKDRSKMGIVDEDDTNE